MLLCVGVVRCVVCVVLCCVGVVGVLLCVVLVCVDLVLCGVFVLCWIVCGVGFVLSCVC